MKKLPSFYATPRPPLTDYQIYVIGGFGKFESFVVTLENKFKKDKVRISARQSWTAQLQGVFSCPDESLRQLYTYPCDYKTFYFLTLKSHPRDMTLRHDIET